jgi:hypothetical protein
MLLLRLGPLLPFYFLLMGVLPGALGWGFWTLKNWARLIVSALLVISLVGAAVEMVHGCPRPMPRESRWRLCAWLSHC